MAKRNEYYTWDSPVTEAAALPYVSPDTWVTADGRRIHRSEHPCYDCGTVCKSEAMWLDCVRTALICRPCRAAMLERAEAYWRTREEAYS